MFWAMDTPAPDLREIAARIGATIYEATGQEGSLIPIDPPPPPISAKPWENKPAIQKISYTHDAMIDLIIARPGVSQNEIAAYFGYTPAWVSRAIHTEAFQGRLKQRKDELVDPTILSSVEERLRGAAAFALDKVMEKLDTANLDQALKVATAATTALGYGARPQGWERQGPQVAVVVNVPQKAATQEDWVSKYIEVSGAKP